MAVLVWVNLNILNAQNKETKNADKHFARLEYIAAIDAYLKLPETTKSQSYVQKKLAEAYRLTQNPVEAEKWYARLLEHKTSNEDYFWYAQMLASNEKYDDSQKWFVKFAAAAPTDSRAIAFQENPDYLTHILSQKPLFTVEKTTLSTGFSDFGAYINNGKVYFASTRNASKQIYRWNNQPTTDLYYANISNGAFTDIRPLEGAVNTKYNEGSVAISPEGLTMFFTRINYNKGNYGKDSAGISNLNIFTAKRNGDVWENITSLPFNNTEYSTGHPALSADGQTLYFSSNMPGGYGKTDLYKVAINPDGSYSNPENLGPDINTPTDEMFPFSGADGTLYFSSNGHPGLGGLDIYYAQATANGFGRVANMGKPINSSKDDFAFYIDDSSQSGFLSSDRDAVSGNDDIYSFTTIPRFAESVSEAPVSASVQHEIQKPLSPKDAILDLGSLRFEFNSSAITEENKYVLDKVIVEMKKNPAIVIQVNAYSDNVGTPEYNLRLSSKRAQSAVDYITARGIAPYRISGKGYGSSSPKVDCISCTPEQNAMNRRLEFVVSKD